MSSFNAELKILLDTIKPARKTDLTIKSLNMGLQNNVLIQLPDYYLDFIIMLIKKFEIKNVLEIGTLYGYSASLLAENCDIKLTTLEHCHTRYNAARDILENFNNIKHINIKAQDFITNNQGCVFDLIIIDANKNEYYEYLQLLQKKELLQKNSIIVADNVLVRPNRKYKERAETITNIQKFINALLNTNNFEGMVLKPYGGSAVFRCI